MINSTLCYIENEDCYLMLHRNKKSNDLNEGKWIGVGGKFEEGEDALACVRREVFEETGLRPDKFEFLGVIEFRNDKYEYEDMYLFLARFDAPQSRIILKDCDEGELKWVKKSEIMSLNLWEGDRYFLEPMLSGEKEINMRLNYSGDELLSTQML